MTSELIRFTAMMTLPFILMFAGLLISSKSEGWD